MDCTLKWGLDMHLEERDKLLAGVFVAISCNHHQKLALKESQVVDNRNVNVGHFRCRILKRTIYLRILDKAAAF